MAVLFNVIGGMMGGAAAWCVAHRGGPGGVERVEKVGGTYFFGVFIFFGGGGLDCFCVGFNSFWF